MGSSVSSIPETNDVNISIRSHYVVYGFVRKSVNMIIPTDILLLCHSFCGVFHDTGLLIWPIFNSKSIKPRLFNINHLTTSTNLNLTNSEKFYIQHVSTNIPLSSFPSRISKPYLKNIQNSKISDNITMIIRGDSEAVSKSKLILFKTSFKQFCNDKMDPFCIFIPSLGYHSKIIMKYKHKTSIHYDKKRNKIYAVGGQLNDNINGISVLNLNNNLKNLKYETVGTFSHWKTARMYSELSLCQVGDCLYVIGSGPNGQACDQIDLSTFKSKSIADTLYWRNGTGSVFNKYTNKIIIVGGGDNQHRSSQTMSLYDFHKDKWLTHKSMMNYCHSSKYDPLAKNNVCAWINPYNPYIVYVAGGFGISLCQTEWVDIRAGTGSWNEFLSRNDAASMTKDIDWLGTQYQIFNV